MAGLIPRQFIDDLLARTDIVELINGRVTLKKAGKNYQACCPFHTEKTPSFSVSPDKQFYHCFGCGEHGNAISFLMEYDRLDFVDAIEELASMQGMEVPREERSHTPEQQRKYQQAQQQKQSDYQLLEQISRFYQQQLRVASDKDVAINYLKSRGLSGEIAKRFGIGYISDNWDGMMNTFAHNHQLAKQLVDLGMAIESENGRRPYDRFRGRIMFPIREKRGKVIGFGGRVLGDGTPKYLNSPETRIYHKGQELYGLYEAKQANKNLQRLVVVEGYMDVVALAQHGIDYAVASLGTSTTAEQLQTLFRTVNEVICCYDGDRAGREAAWRAMDNALPLVRDGVSLKFVFLPDGEDPDSLVRQQGQQAFEQVLEQAQPLSKFLLENLIAKVDMTSLEGRASLAESFQPFLNKMPASILKESLINEIANNFGTGSEHLAKQLSQASPSPAKAQAKANTPTRTTPARLAIALLLESPALAQTLPNPQVLGQLDQPGVSLLTELLEICTRSPNINSGQIIEMYRDRVEGKQLAKLLCWEHQINADNAEDVFLDSIEKLLNTLVEQRTELLLQKGRLNQLTAQEKRELQALLNEQSL
ncbi:DNA primase [Thalassotalea euphylliae]|uniref:DNA primase n=1 Tax=Thalassotalea euphylliae TaxID=1655234 RepID=A0A3E0UHK0_9GAMM|nr:DNA primase [Thalassotalea euphylliae]REL36521.1 DNA primase [Thalassotalea euphylliae]